MKVLMIARPDLFSMPGGDTVQIEQTAKHLKQLGVEVDINIQPKGINYRIYSLLHFFNIIDPEDILGHLYKSQLPFVLSTIYLNDSEFDSRYRKGIVGFLGKILPKDSIEYLKTAGKFILKGQEVSTLRFFFKGHRSSIKYILNKSAYLLPNSENEYKRVLADYGIKKKYFVVPNAVDIHAFVASEDKKRDLVICVGRIEGRKNQLNLIRAINQTNLKLVLIGYDSPNQKAYVEQCKKEAGNNVLFASRLNQEQLKEFYLTAKVHVLPSWFETTGLSSLEAALMGCNIVVGDRGDVRDYFDGYAEFCEPDNIESIKQAILKAYNKPFNEELRKHILNNFTWEKAAKVTLEAYQKTLNEQ